jgi:DNA-binding LacI/PurR family transcriptional regulator
MGRPPTAKPTSFDIAYLAGVSQPTVSRALRGSKSVSAATRANIERIARELNYTVDKNASSLRSQRAHTLALLFFEDPTPDESMINPFFLSMLGSITRQCALRGYDLLISFQQMNNDWHVDYQDSHRSDGIILLGYGDYQLYRAKLEHLVEMDTKFVRWGSVADDNIGLTVGSDNIGAGGQAGEHFIEIGRKSIAFLGDASNHAPEFQDRYAGLCRAMTAAGLTPDPRLQQPAVSSEQSGYEAARAQGEVRRDLRRQRPDRDRGHARARRSRLGTAARRRVDRVRRHPRGQPDVADADNGDAGLEGCRGIARRCAARPHRRSARRAMHLADAADPQAKHIALIG